MTTFPGMRSRVVSEREMRERFGVVVKPFPPAFVIPRRYPGWEQREPGAAGPTPRGPGRLNEKTVRYIDIPPRA